ncbi:hypothetical protein PHET_12248 [Paragonimus heterotremus]|uniref:C3H1-type domain-containing protein n=1 Tax=Paragonimus heterotremus TaxID=100268 RepID=A0A8J4SJ89_9TREM|nr:hypothetical protein PHET_12248 [Paragonimus heterotremus]
MSDPEKKICRYFNTLGGCWYGDSCKFLHIPNKKPPCKFYGSSSGCRYGESCHFSHDRTPFKSVENFNNPPVELMKEVSRFLYNVCWSVANIPRFRTLITSDWNHTVFKHTFV